MVYEFKPRGVCSSKIIIEYENDIVNKVEIIGGCPGNTAAVSKLCEGRKLAELVDTLKGIDCRGRGTSCPNELSIAFANILNENL